MKVDLLEWLQAWYSNQVNDHWEHQYGIVIETLDNPGWHLSIDLEMTKLESKNFSQIRIENNEQDWLTCKVEKGKFEGFCGPKNLRRIIEVFQGWVEGS